ncbi:hypothetical protein C8R44DRAFT_783046 [Mycena epipterygia]|nr:hypothetical protein C8R44DRAFT_783046 [Mycena epipterygia]
MLEKNVLQDVHETARAGASQRARPAPKPPQLDSKPEGSLRDYLHSISECIAIGVEIPPFSVELMSKVIEGQIEYYEGEILAMRTDPDYLWDELEEELHNSPGAAIFCTFVTSEQCIAAPKRVEDYGFFYGRAFKARVYHVYHFLSVWTWIGKAFKEMKTLGYTTENAETEILKKPKIHTLIHQINGVCLRELRQDLSRYFHRALASSAQYSRFFHVEWDGCTVHNSPRYLEDVEVRLKPDALQQALPGLETSLLRLCDPDAMWDSPQFLRVIDAYIRCTKIPGSHITERLSELVSEYASLSRFLDLLLRPFKAPSIRKFYRDSHIHSPPIPRQPGWDISSTGMLYGGQPIYRLNFARRMLEKEFHREAPDWLSSLWKTIDDTYVENTSKSINDYWEIASVEERPPQWHDSRNQTSSADVAVHAVYELPRKTVKIIHRVLRNQDGGSEDSEGKVTWKDVCKLFRSLNFTIDDSIPGSAVNFTPPSPNDRPIKIHRPHPNPELSPLKIHQLGARLRRVYGWSEDWFKISKAAE